MVGSYDQYLYYQHNKLVSIFSAVRSYIDLPSEERLLRN